MRPIDRPHLADIVFSAHRIDPGKEIANPLKIKSYSVEYIPILNAPDLTGFSEILSPEVSITVPETGSSEDEVAGQFKLMTTEIKQEYFATGAGEREYKAVYTFTGEDALGNQFSFGGIGRAEAIFTIGRFGKCEEDLVVDDPPPPPTNPTVDVESSIFISPGEVKLTWTAPDPAPPDLKGYKIYRNNIPIVDVLLEPTTSFIDSGLAAGTYNYQVTAVDDADNESTRADFEPITIE